MLLTESNAGFRARGNSTRRSTAAGRLMTKTYAQMKSFFAAAIPESCPPVANARKLVLVLTGRSGRAARGYSCTVAQ